MREKKYMNTFKKKKREMKPKSLFMSSAFGEVSQVKQIVSVDSGWVRESTRGRTMSVYQLSCSFHYRISQLVFPNWCFLDTFSAALGLC